MTGSNTGRRYWARQLIERAPRPIPAYGSTEWLMLPVNDVSRIAATVVAAECWAWRGDELQDDLRREIEDAQVAFKHDEDADYQAKAAAHRQRYKGATVSDFVARRTKQVEAAKPRPGDHPGGPVQQEGGPA